MFNQLNSRRSVICGQNGIAGTVSTAAEKVFQKMLVYNSVRGTDSTGAASVKRHEEKGKAKVVVAKELGDAWNFLSLRRKHPQTDISTVLQSFQRALLGHCRSATIGSTHRRNAHPFSFDNIVGTHNGTLTYTTHKELESYSKVDTDSEAFMAEVDQYGIAEASKKLRDADQYAFVWYDNRDDTINFLRNKTRPLWYAFDKDRKQLVWSSEKGHLYSGMLDIQSDFDIKELYELPPDIHMSWVVPGENKAFDKGHAVKREGRKPAPLLQSWSGNGSTTRELTGQGYGTTNSPFRDDDPYFESWAPAEADKAPRTYPDDDSPWWDISNHCYQRWSEFEKSYVYAYYKHGVYYKTPQKLWESLPFIVQTDKAFRGEQPTSVTLTAIVLNEVQRRRKMTALLPPPQPSEEKVEIIEGEVIDPTEDTEVVPDQIKGVLEKTPPEDRVVRLEEMKNKVRERRLKAALHNKEAVLNPVFSDSERKVYWDRQDHCYTVVEWKSFTEGWETTNVFKCPEWVPFTMLDIQARHQFKHSGKGKKKVTSYRGYDGALLVQKSFETLMSQGCINCSREPQWGNDVLFVNHTDFFCEHCKRDETLVSQIKTMAGAD